MKPKILILITVILAISSGVNSQKDEVVEDAVYGAVKTHPSSSTNLWH